jgi:hypothetical protein
MIVTCSACGREMAAPRDKDGRPERFWHCWRMNRAATAK